MFKNSGSGLGKNSGSIISVVWTDFPAQLRMFPVVIIMYTDSTNHREC
jgi:hypothetical protein